MRSYTFRTPKLLKKLYPNLIWDFKNRGDKSIYLTFDDGPIPEVTPFVLDALKTAGVKATFFVVGDNVRKHPDILKQVKDAGHPIGNHTFNHLNGWKTGTDQYLRNVKACDEILKANDVITDLLRPPYGRISRAQIAQLTDDYRIIMWDYLTGDFDQSLSSDKLIRKYKKGVRSGSVVVFHDNIKAFGKLKATLPVFLNYFKEQGYTFEVL